MIVQPLIDGNVVQEDGVGRIELSFQCRVIQSRTDNVILLFTLAGGNGAIYLANDQDYEVPQYYL